jgi:hypothetical protein
MKRNLGVAAALTAISLATAGGPALAEVPCAPLDLCVGDPCPILIQFDANAFAYETNYSTATFISQPGSQMTVVGLITQFGPALPFLNPNDPNKEYTFVFSGLISAGTIVSTNGPTTLYDTDYDSTKVATFAIYEGTPRNSPDTPAEWTANPFGGVLVPASHQDGTLILSGELCGFHTNIARTGTIVSGSFRSNYRPTGGTLYPYITGTEGLLGGNWCANLSGCRPANYTAHPNGKFDATGQTTPVSRATWGRLKQIYR